MTAPEAIMNIYRSQQARSLAITRLEELWRCHAAECSGDLFDALEELVDAGLIRRRDLSYDLTPAGCRAAGLACSPMLVGSIG